MYGNQASTLRNLAFKVIFQTASSSMCEKNLSTFALIRTKQRNWIAYPKLQQLIFCYYNMKLKIRDMKVETDKVVENDILIYFRFQLSFVKKIRINYSNGLDFSI